MVAVVRVANLVANLQSVFPVGSGSPVLRPLPSTTLLQRGAFLVLPPAGERIAAHGPATALRVERFSKAFDVKGWNVRESVASVGLEEALAGEILPSRFSGVLRTFLMTHYGGEVQQLAQRAALHDSTVRGMLDPQHVHASWRPAVMRIAKKLGEVDGKGLILSWAASVLAKELKEQTTPSLAHPDLEKGWKLLRLAELISGKKMPKLPRDPFSIDYFTARLNFVHDALEVDATASRTFGKVILAENEILRMFGNDWYDAMLAWEDAEDSEQDAVPQHAIRAWSAVTQHLAVALGRARETWFVDHIRRLYATARERALDLATPDFDAESRVDILGTQPFPTDVYRTDVIWLPPADQLAFREAWLGLPEDRRRQLVITPRRILQTIEVALLGGEIYAFALSPMLLGVALRRPV